jgi:hypothetical protein
METLGSRAVAEPWWCSRAAVWERVRDSIAGNVADDPSARDRFPYPGGNVLGVLLDESALNGARDRLAQAGFAPDRYDVLEGERDVGRIDVKGERHGLVGTVERWLQRVFSDDAEHARRYAEHLREGHFVLGVSVGEDEAAKQRAADALRGADAQFINYYAENYVEDLGAGA